MELVGSEICICAAILPGVNLPRILMIVVSSTKNLRLNLELLSSQDGSATRRTVWVLVDRY